MGELRDKARTYTSAFGASGEILGDKSGRARKARKIRAVLEEAGALPHGNARLLDIGCSHGHILEALSADVGCAIGVDLDDHVGWRATEKIRYARADAEYLPFADDCFDIVICNHVYEHTDNPQALVDQIYRVLKPRGICYFSGPNKFDMIEPHYRLPLLSWLPRWLADIYVRAFNKGQAYPEQPLSLVALRRLLRRFDAVDYTRRIVRDPVLFAIEDMLAPGSLKHFFAKMMSAWFPFLFPTYVFVLRKRA